MDHLPQVTASGDQMAKLWDLKCGELLGTFKGHQCSVKSVAFTKDEKGTIDIFSSRLLSLYTRNSQSTTLQCVASL